MKEKEWLIYWRTYNLPVRVTRTCNFEARRILKILPRRWPVVIGSEIWALPHAYFIEISNCKTCTSSENVKYRASWRAHCSITGAPMMAALGWFGQPLFATLHTKRTRTFWKERYCRLSGCTWHRTCLIGGLLRFSPLGETAGFHFVWFTPFFFVSL